MAGMGKDKKNPGPAEQTFTKQKNLQRPRGSVAGSTGQKAGADEQFNKGNSYNEDDGSSKSASVNSHPGKISKVGSSDMGDEQFDSHLQDNPRSGKLGSKSSGGTPGSFDSSNPSPAQQIMREIAKASQKPDQHSTQYQGSKKVSPAKSPNQTKSFNDSGDDNVQARAKSQLSQKVKKA